MAVRRNLDASRKQIQEEGNENRGAGPCKVGKVEAKTDRKTRGGVTAESPRKTRLRASAGERGHRVGLDNSDHPGSQGELR
jgi:hypothetical protein